MKPTRWTRLWTIIFPLSKALCKENTKKIIEPKQDNKTNIQILPGRDNLAKNLNEVYLQCRIWNFELPVKDRYLSTALSIYQCKFNVEITIKYPKDFLWEVPCRIKVSKGMCHFHTVVSRQDKRDVLFSYVHAVFLTRSEA